MQTCQSLVWVGFQMTLLMSHGDKLAICGEHLVLDAVSVDCHIYLGHAGQKLQDMTMLWPKDTYRSKCNQVFYTRTGELSKVKILNQLICLCFCDVWWVGPPHAKLIVWRPGPPHAKLYGL